MNFAEKSGFPTASGYRRKHVERKLMKRMSIAYRAGEVKFVRGVLEYEKTSQNDCQIDSQYVSGAHYTRRDGNVLLHDWIVCARKTCLRTREKKIFSQPKPKARNN